MKIQSGIWRAVTREIIITCDGNMEIDVERGKGNRTKKI